MLVEHTLFGIEDKVEIAIKRLKTFEPKNGYYLAFSGGKDSIVIKHLAEQAGVKFETHYHVTTVDPPELVKFIKKYHSDVIMDLPKEPLLKCAERYGLPLRTHRWCCALYKERGGHGRVVITGVRWEESNRRAERRMIERCRTDETKTFNNIIIDWTEHDVWEYIRQNKLPYCELYDEGWKRIGCLFCPMNTKREEHAKRYPKYAELFRRAANVYFDNYCKNDIILRLGSGDAYFRWWLTGEGHKHKDEEETCVMFE